MTSLFSKIFREEEDSGQVAVDYLLGLTDGELKNFNEAIALFRKGDRLREEHYEKARNKLAQADDIEILQTELDEELANAK